MTVSTPLGGLIDRVKDANHWSDQDICDNAGRHGHKLVKQTLSDIRHDRIAMISPRTIRAVADGLGISVNEVVRAALAQLGLAAYHPDDWSAEEAVRADAGLGAETKRAVLAILAAARAAPPTSGSATASAVTHFDLDMAARAGASRARRDRSASDGASAQ